MSSVNCFKMIIEHGIAFLILIVLPLITVKMRTTLQDTLLQLVFVSHIQSIGPFGLVLISLEYLRKQFTKNNMQYGLYFLLLSI